MAENLDWLEDAPTNAELAALDAPDKRWPENLANLMDVLMATYQRFGIDDDRALDLAQQSALAIGQYQGGRQYYLPCGKSLQLAVRDRRIFLEANRNNKVALARRHGMTVRRLEQIVAEQRAVHVSRAQGRLFGDSILSTKNAGG